MAAEEFVTALLGHASDAIAVSERESGRYVVVSDSYCALTGYGRDELIGRTSVELGLVADTSARERALRDRTAGTMHELRLRRKDGEVREFEFSVQLLAGGLMLTISRDVTERRRIEARLKESEERFRVAVESMLDAFTIISPVRDPHGEVVDFRYEYVNDAYCALIGLDREQILGRRGGDVSPDFTSSDRFATYRQVLSTGEPRTVEDVIPVAAREGTHLARGVIEINVVPFDGNLVVSGRDITERREAEAELALRAELLELAHDAVIVRDSGASRVTFWNVEAEAVYGYTFAEAAGRVSHELLATVFPESREAVEEALAREGHWQGVLEHARKDGEVILVSSRQALRRDVDGRPTTIIELNSDITEHDRAETEIRQAKEQAERANRAKSEFLSRMSHELRTPLHAILGFGELLEREDLKPGQREKLVHMTKGAGHLLALVNEALDLTAIERGALTLSLEPVHLGELVQETLAMIVPLAAASSLSISAPADAALDVHVRADRQRLKQALLNLLSNAVKYNRERGEVTLATSRVDGDVRIEVIDNGRGIAAEDLPRVFEPFDRLGAEATEVEGTGLGLTLTKRLIEAMGGPIGVESEVGRGTRFWLELPVVEAPSASALPRKGDPAAASSRLSGETRTVLYIEDNPSNIRLVETILAEREEVTLLVASQGSLGLELAREHRPSLILLDLNLPDLSGEEVLRRLRSHPHTAGTPVVMLSADATPRQVERLRNAGADEYLTKPFGFEQFLALIDDLTTRSESGGVAEPPG